MHAHVYIHIYVSICDFRCVILCIYILPRKPRSSRSRHYVSKFTGTLIPPHPTQTPKFTKHTWREQVHRDVTIPPHPTQTPKFTKHTWREQVHPTPPKPRSSRSIHDVSKFTGTLTSPPPQTQKKCKKKGGFVTSCLGAALGTKHNYENHLFNG